MLLAPHCALRNKVTIATHHSQSYEHTLKGSAIQKVSTRKSFRSRDLLLL